MPAPTPEQSAAVDTFRRGDHLVLQAGAGTGKTTTLAMLAASTTKPGRYIAFNKSIANEAAHKFPSSVRCKTAHSLAFGAVGHKYGSRMNAPRVPGWKTGASLGIAINMRIRIGERNVTNKALSYTVLRRFDHDHYLKIWALTEPRIEADFLLLDEAQDTNPVVEKIFNAQRNHTQLVMVGDSAQAIYGWRGARDVMSAFDGTQLALSQSFRFGSALAEEANRWLHIVESPIRLTGTPAINTRLERVKEPDAILCRSNVGAMLEVMRLLEEGPRVALVGGGEALRALARAARDLKAGKRSTHPELILFDSWGELQEYAEYDPSGRDLLPLVDLVDGPRVIVAVGSTACALASDAGLPLGSPRARRPQRVEQAGLKLGVLAAVDHHGEVLSS